jgi:hypothetical protein
MLYRCVARGFAVCALTALGLASVGTAAASAGSYVSPGFSCAPASWCLVPGVNGTGTGPYEPYYYVQVSSLATFLVSATAGVYNSTDMYFGSADGAICFSCAANPTVDWYDTYPQADGYLVVYNWDSSHTRTFQVDGYW